MRPSRAGALAGVALASIGCDHAVKRVAQRALGDGGAVDWAGGSVRFERVANPGAFLGLGADLPEPLRDALLLVGVPLLLAVLCVALLRGPAVRGREFPALGLVAGGGLANWLDRLLHDGAVIDFVSIGIGPLRTGVFNLADVAVLTGLVLLVLPGRTAPSRNSV